MGACLTVGKWKYECTEIPGLPLVVWVLIAIAAALAVFWACYGLFGGGCGGAEYLKTSRLKS